MGSALEIAAVPHVMEIDVVAEGKTNATVRVRGDLTGGGADRLKNALAEIRGIPRWVLDLSGMRYLDVTGAALLCDLLCDCMRWGRSVAIVGVPPRYLKAMEQMGFSRFQAATVGGAS